MRLRTCGMCVAVVVVAGACAPEGTGLARTPAGTGPRVSFDVQHKPLPEIPLPNDFATHFDPATATKRRLNASEVAPTSWERKTRAQLDQLDGWGTLAPISVSFDQPLDVENILRRHTDEGGPASDDVIVVVDVTPSSPEFCKQVSLDLGNGHFPLRLDRPDYYPDDPRGNLTNLWFDETEEDLNHNGVLDPGEDTDMDGVLDHPNTRSAADPTLLTFYERESRTLIARPIYPLREATTYAVVLTKNLVGEDGAPVRSPFEYVNHTAQSKALEPLRSTCLAQLGLAVDDVTFSWTFTTQNWTRPIVALRDGLYGVGNFAHLSTDYPATPVLRELRPKTGGVNPRIVPNDAFMSLAKDLLKQLGSGGSPTEEKLFFDNFEFIDFHALGFIDSPQVFPRFAEDGKTQLSLADQVWQVDPATGAAFVRHENVTFWLTIPKNRHGPAPVAIFIHGHGGTKFAALDVAGFLARRGIATLAIDVTGHGVGLDAVKMELIRGEFKSHGLEGLGVAMLDGRALDQNGDGVLDSGADYWTSYIFHTRDVVRQTAIDIMQVVRTLRSFDGTRTWKYDANGDGKPDLAGDFDGDGTVDVGGTSPLHLFGGSLGGIISSYVGGLEPAFDTAIPIIGGGGLGDIGTRSSLGGVRDGMVLRMMAPLVYVRDGDVIEALPDLTDYTEVKVATLLTTPKPGSIAVLRNLDTGEWRCGRFQASGHLRVAVPSDKGNRLALELYSDELPSRSPEGCQPQGEPAERITAFSVDAKWQSQPIAKGSDFVALGDGFGLRRGTPELRRMLGLAQIGLEGADPANSAPFLHQDRVLTYGTGETVATRMFYINTMGDSGVPTASGVTMARAAGLINFHDIDPRYGKTVQRLLIDKGVVESVEASKRFVNASGDAVLIDIDDLQSLSTKGGDGFDVPRLSPPLRLVRDNAKIGGKSGMLFPMMEPHGVHGFPTPKPDRAFDLGSLLINQMTRYLASDGTELDFDGCQLDWSCTWLPAQ